ncbi:MAG: signal recognition particle-docking protein FtsY [Acholeplasmataceae bacterium]
MGFFKNLFSKKPKISYEKALNRSHVSLFSVKESMEKHQMLHPDVLEALEDALLLSDVGLDTTTNIIDYLIETHKKTPICDYELLLDWLYQYVDTLFLDAANLQHKHVIFVVGVNGVGKTTTIGKLAHQMSHNQNVMIIAADTFRAAAIDQLRIWAEKSDVLFYTNPSKDPSSVIYDGLKLAKEKDIDVILIDTAGRLQNKHHLMAELTKMRHMIPKAYGTIDIRTYLVLDATTGQNGLSQAKLFHEATYITDLVITKLDGTSKGGIVLPIVSMLKVPIAYIGIGEGIDDLAVFDKEAFLQQLIDHGV